MLPNRIIIEGRWKIWPLRSISIGKISVEEPVSEGTEFIEYEVDVISLQGISNSPEAMACAEWNAFYEEYDKDGAILSEIGNAPTGLDSEYTEAYNCYTQEMADKVDEICEKYQLSKLKDITIADTYEELCSKADIGAICMYNGLSVQPFCKRIVLPVYSKRHGSKRL